MKIPTEIVLENGKEYCMKCFHDSLEVKKEEGVKYYICTSCSSRSNRRISADASIRWWLDAERKFWHESVGIFVFNTEGKILFFELTKFPFGLTVPAGHRDPKEESIETARRELLEETGLRAGFFTLLGEEDIVGDSCGRGADDHTWSAFTCIVDSPDTHLDSSEGKNAVWISLEDIPQKDLTVPVKYFIEKYRDVLKEVSLKAIGVELNSSL